MQLTDFVFENHLSVALLYPITPAVGAWLDAHVQSEDWQRLGSGIVIEPRYAQPILEALVADGLTVS